MPKPMRKTSKNERLLVLVVDIDNDLYRKTRISGPLVGRVQNLSAATQLSLSDPEDTDANTMFQAVKTYDSLKKDGYSVNIATVTGAENGGYYADREVASQLEKVIAQTKADSCVFVTDGASDERALPIIESRLKINSMMSITVKQSKALEKTYVAALEKLKEPHYARIVFGIPAILLLLFAISYAAGLSWQVPAALIGTYLFLKAFGLEDMFLNSLSGFGFSLDKISFVFYLGSIIFLIASLFIGGSSYVSQLRQSRNVGLAFSYGLEGFLLLVPVVMILYLAGRMIDIKASRYTFRSFRYGVYFGYSIMAWALVYSSMAWLVGQIYFGQLLYYTIIAIALGLVISASATLLRRRAIRRKNLRNKLVVNELGSTIGKVAKVDSRRGGLIINTSLGNPIRYNIDRIIEISDKVVIK